jgi:hypothetical protein
VSRWTYPLICSSLDRCPGRGALLVLVGARHRCRGERDELQWANGLIFMGKVLQVGSAEGVRTAGRVKARPGGHLRCPARPVDRFLAGYTGAASSACRGTWVRGKILK